MARAAEQKTVKVKLTKKHRHRGTDRAAGEVIDVNPRQARWLIDDLKKAVPAPQEG